MALNLSRLRMLYELERLGTVGAVADVLHYTHSAVSQQLSQLEKETGHALLEKAGRGVVLTDAGRTLAGYAERLLTLADEAESALARTGPVGGTIKVASFQTVLVALIPETVAVLAERYPDLHVEFIQREVLDGIESLLDHEVDVCIGEQFPGTRPIGGKGLVRRDFHTEPLLLVQPTKGEFSAPLPLAQMAGFPWIIDPKGSAAGQFTWSVCQSAGFEPRTFIESPDPLLALQIVGQGRAIAILPSLIVGRFPERVAVRVLPGDPGRVLFTATRPGRENHPAIVAFCDALAEVTKRLQAET